MIYYRKIMPMTEPEKIKAYLYLMTTWNIMSGIADSEDIVVKIDGKEIPHMGLVHDISKGIIINKGKNNIGI